MTTSTTTATTAIPTRKTLVQPLLQFFRTPKGILLVVLALLTIVALPEAGGSHVALGVLGAMAVAAAVDVLIVRTMRGVWFFPSGALLSGLIVALVLSPEEPWYVPLLTAALAINVKYLLRLRGKHIFNPAALALVAACVVLASGQSWWGALADRPAPLVAILIATGLFVASRVNKLPMLLVFLGGYFLLFTLVTFVSDPARIAEIFRAPDVNAALFFAFFMLTDPPTSPARYRDQVIFGLIVAVASCAIYLTLSGLYFLPAALLVGNAWEAWRRVTARARTPRAASR